MAKKKYIGRFLFDLPVTRESDANYTHAWLIRWIDSDGKVVLHTGFSTSRDLAEKALKRGTPSPRPEKWMSKKEREEKRKFALEVAKTLYTEIIEVQQV